MDADAANGPPLPEPPGPAAELVVRGGRLDGASRTIRPPVTLIGQAPGCDVRLNADGVEPIHCALLSGPDGLILRDLDTPSGTRVNGQPIRAQRLRDGDEVQVGPFVFAVSLSAPPSTSETIAVDAILLDREREALQVQIAAVAAQQAALAEEELRLQNRALALERQEAQLAAHLEDRQRRLDELQEQVLADRDRDARARADLARDQEAARLTALDTAQQRQRVANLRRKLVKRYRRHWDAQEALTRRREAAAAALADRLERERAAARAFHEKVNAELEIGRCRLREEWQELALAQQQWEEALNAERGDQARRLSDLHQQAARTAAAEHALAEAQRQWQLRQTDLAREVEGLESRARHERARLDALRREAALLEQQARPSLAAAEAFAAPLSAPVAPPAGPPWPSSLADAAEEVRDQRAHLREQWLRLLATHQDWHQQKAEVLALLAPAAADLDRRADDLAAEARRLDALRADLDALRAQLDRDRTALAAGRARLAEQEAAWRAERGRALLLVESRERQLEVRGRLLLEAQRRRNRRREQEQAHLRDARARCEEARRQYSELWRECELLRAALARQERTLAGKALALERYRQELVHRAPDSPRAESRLSRLEAREQERLAEEARAVRAERRALLLEAARLTDQAAHLRQREANLDSRDADLDRLTDQAEARLAAASEDALRRDEETRLLRGQLSASEQQRRHLRDEIERLARALLDDAPDALPPARAA